MKRKDRRVQIPAGDVWRVGYGWLWTIVFIVMGYIIKVICNDVQSIKQEIEAFVLLMIGLAVTLVGLFWAVFIHIQLDLAAFAYCIFDEKGVTLRPLFRRKIRLEYDKCVAIGIARQPVKVFNTGDLVKTYHDIYLSYKRIPISKREPYFKGRISKDCIVIGFRKKTYRYLMEHLPPDLAGKLRWSDDALYEKVMGDRKPNRDK